MRENRHDAKAANSEGPEAKADVVAAFEVSSFSSSNRMALLAPCGSSLDHAYSSRATARTRTLYGSRVIGNVVDLPS